ncbi:MAG: NADPH:quinone oxidoreductase family protein [Rhizobiaceae bacterium]|nr:MAG: NADPH:quinone oxidoreductase family protein [Rhizobiaceae bacterium]
MRAVLCRAFGPVEDLRLEDVASPVAGQGMLCVSIEACGINFFDGLAVQGQYQTKPPFPFSPGGEVAGVVTALGEGVEGLSLGDRVMAFVGFGGYAEEIAVPAAVATKIPEAMSFEEAAGFMIAYATSHHALKDRAALKPGETLLVLGAAGGVGLTAVEIGKAMGARVIAAASSDDKLVVASRHGADDLVNYSDGELKDKVKALTGGRGVDVVYDPVGGKLAEAALRAMAPEGRFLVIGFASGDIPSIPLNQYLLRQVSAVGVFWGAFAKAEPERNAANVAELLAWYEAGKLRPHISETYPLERFQEGLGRVMSRQARGKVVLTTGRSAA